MNKPNITRRNAGGTAFLVALGVSLVLAIWAARKVGNQGDSD